LAVDNLSQINDKRRSLYDIDKSFYYKETTKDTRQAAHHPACFELGHDTSTYYGPYPVSLYIYNDFRN